MDLESRYDVVIIGGGLAGLTLSLQLKQSKADISILILEKRSLGAPIATHKVGESMSELGSSYLRDVLNLKEYLETKQLPKYGLRFFFSPEHRADIARRVELGSMKSDVFPSHQIDRGIFENDLIDKLQALGVHIILGAKLTETTIHKEGHTISFNKEGKSYSVHANWLVDASGRAGYLQRKLQLQKTIDHNVNAVWFRLDTEIDIDDWSDNPTWRNKVAIGRRHYATNHLMGEGYWIWIIPLVSGQTSIGIVADPDFHPFEKINSFEKALQWMAEEEPQAAAQFQMHRDKLMDFKLMKHFAFDTTQFYSSDKWALIGEAGAFMDPFYSPGMDFIALGNTWTTDLIIRDLKGEDILLRTLFYEKAEQELINSWMLLYKDMYGLLGKTPIMMMKIIWDWATYWAIPALMFMNEGYTNLKVLKYYAATSKGVGPNFSKLNTRIQSLLRQWAKYPVASPSDTDFDFFILDFLLKLHEDLHHPYSPEILTQKITTNLKLLEVIAAEMFRLVSAEVHGTPDDMPVNPYKMSLDMGRTALMEMSLEVDSWEVDQIMKKDLAKVWMAIAKTQKNELLN